jgi:prephenate dehydratase
MKIGIQGTYGAFHEIAAQHYFSADAALEIVPIETFEELVAAVVDVQDCDGALMAIENSIAGSLLQNYKLLKDNDLYIVGEVFLRIQQNLMLLPGQSLNELTEVHSHPVALMQCTAFFEKMPHVRLIESTDTAVSARMIQQGQLRGIGAIASTLAAEMYDLEIVAPSIETFKQNYTRFLVIQKTKNHVDRTRVNKASICFSLKDEVGSLYKVLAQLVLRNANMTKIQSVAMPEVTWTYLFFLDFTFQSYNDFEVIMHEIKDFITDLRLLGTYEAGTYFGGH